MIPKGTKIIGSASTYHSEDRVIIEFNTMVFPDGSELSFKGLALQTDGSAGLSGEVKKATYKVPVNIILGAAGSIIPGVGGDLAKGLSSESQKQMDTSIPDTIITVKKDTGILIYVINRINIDKNLVKQ